MKLTAYDVAQRFVGVHEREGDAHHPLIQYCFALCPGFGLDTPDEIPWCSAFMQLPAHVCNVVRSRSARARSWLAVGRVVDLAEARCGWDVVILKRGGGSQPGPEVLDAPGHVGLFSALDNRRVWLLGGNQGDEVKVAPFDTSRVLGVRRLFAEN